TCKVTLRFAGVIVPGGRPLHVSVNTVTPGWPAVGEVVAARVIVTGVWPQAADPEHTRNVNRLRKLRGIGLPRKLGMSEPGTTALTG
ncbi:MAG: hypothetical protein C5B51_06565, partial [Terriglobia bacterium]